MCAVDSINHYFTISRMFSAGSRYWNNAKGLFPGEVESDEEDLDTMKQLGENIVWFLRMRSGALPEDANAARAVPAGDRGDAVMYDSAGKRIHP